MKETTYSPCQWNTQNTRTGIDSDNGEVTFPFIQDENDPCLMKCLILIQ